MEDDGPGLPPGDPARLFEKFQRGTGEGTIVGVGLGLAICRAIIRAHGGEIEAHVRRRAPGSSSPCPHGDQERMTQAMHQILVIEDDPEIRAHPAGLLGAEGSVAEAASAARADIEARAHKPDLLLWIWGCPTAMA